MSEAMRLALKRLLARAERDEADDPQAWLDYACGECVGWDRDRGAEPELCARHAAVAALSGQETDDALARALRRVEALEALVVMIGKAWDAFDEALVVQRGGVDGEHDTFHFEDSPEAWQAYHKIDGLVADFQLGPPAAKGDG